MNQPRGCQLQVRLTHTVPDQNYCEDEIEPPSNTWLWAPTHTQRTAPSGEDTFHKLLWKLWNNSKNDKLLHSNKFPTKVWFAQTPITHADSSVPGINIETIYDQLVSNLSWNNPKAKKKFMLRMTTMSLVRWPRHDNRNDQRDIHNIHNDYKWPKQKSHQHFH